MENLGIVNTIPNLRNFIIGTKTKMTIVKGVFIQTRWNSIILGSHNLVTVTGVAKGEGWEGVRVGGMRKGLISRIFVIGWGQRWVKGDVKCTRNTVSN